MTPVFDTYQGYYCTAIKVTEMFKEFMFQIFSLALFDTKIICPSEKEKSFFKC